MPINPAIAQDVWKDIGQSVQFTVLKFKDLPAEELKEVVEAFADRSQAIIRSLRIRDGQNDGTPSQLKVAIGISNHAWDILFPNTKKPKELETYETLKGPKYEMPATEGDLFFHIRAQQPSRCCGVPEPVYEVLEGIHGSA